MSNRDNGGPAFPSAWQNEGDQGMTLRDYFAAHAMAALIAEPLYEGGSSMLWRVSGGHTFDGLEEERAAAAAYKLADAMLEQRIGHVSRALIAERERSRRLREALRTASTALDDWLNDYASEFCDEQRVREARERINAKGTIGYIGDVQQVVRAALSETEGE